MSDENCPRWELPIELGIEIILGGNYLMDFGWNFPGWKLPNVFWVEIVLGGNSWMNFGEIVLGENYITNFG